jgi:hypothetical protein
MSRTLLSWPLAAMLLVALPSALSAQVEPVVIPRGPLTEAQAQAVAQLPYVPTDRVHHWSGDTLLVSHLEVHGTGLGFFVNCFGSGFFKVPLGGGYPVAAGEPFCALGGNLTAMPDGSGVLFFGEPRYGRGADGTVGRVAGAALMRYDLVTSTTDTLRTECGSGARDVAVSSSGQLAWTGPCGETPAAPSGRESSAGVYVAALGGGAARRAGGPEDLDAHEPSWSPDGAALVFTAGVNGLGGRWEVNRTQPGMLWVADGGGARSLGVTGESAVWSPEGTRIAFFADDRADPNDLPGGPRIYVMRSDGTESRRVFLNDLVSTYPEYFYGPFPTYVRDGKAFGPLVWSPDGRWLAFSRQFEEGASVWRLEVDTGRLERVTAPDA